MFGLGATMCGCGAPIAEGLGRYGCPNCGGDEGAAAITYQLQRHRLFEFSGLESSVPFAAPRPCAHEGQPLPVYGHAGGRSKRDGLRFPTTAIWRAGMGIEWMTGNELAEAIPPEYTTWVGAHLIEGLE